MTAIVEATQLRKVYRRRGGEPVVAIQGLDLTLGTPGTVHGFLGPNGSGKTTTIRCLLGLIRPSAGTAKVFGANSTSSFHTVSDRVGAIVENPKMFPKFSGHKNLSLLAKLGGIPTARIDEALDIVGLTGRGGDSFESYSLGMKQRLAIGAALLKDPDLLILDEPANGLDPAGIAEMRVLIRNIADHGKAVLVSSHQLAEIEQVCDEVTIIAKGELVQSGSLGQVLSSAGSERVVVTIADRPAAMAALAAAGLASTPLTKATEFVVEVPPDATGHVTRILADAGHYLEGLRVDRATLESAFLNLTGQPSASPGMPMPQQPTPQQQAAHQPPPPGPGTGEVAQ